MCHPIQNMSHLNKRKVTRSSSISIVFRIRLAAPDGRFVPASGFFSIIFSTPYNLSPAGVFSAKFIFIGQLLPKSLPHKNCLFTFLIPLSHLSELFPIILPLSELTGSSSDCPMHLPSQEDSSRHARQAHHP